MFDDVIAVDPARAYKVNDCVYLIDPVTGKGDKRDAMRVGKIDAKYYWYRWYVYSGSLGLDLLNTIGKHEQFERLTRILDRCPDGK
jgi:hypothetical protein